MAAWIKIQAAKEAKIQAQIDKVEAAQAQLLQNRIMAGLVNINKTLDKVMQKLDNMPQIIALPVKIVINVIVRPILNIISQIPQAINNIQAFFSNIGRFISSVSEKLASVFGEVKNFIDAKIAQPLKKAIKTVLAFFTQGQDEENEEVDKLKAREIKKVLKGLFRIRSKAREEEKEEENEN
jgi:predicted PurR-regulated permease PerM